MAGKQRQVSYVSCHIDIYLPFNTTSGSSMNTEEFFSVASQIKDFIAFMVPVVIAIFSFLYVRARAGSAGFLHDRLWRLLGGKKDYCDPALQAEYDRLSDHEKFNYSTGIRFQSQSKITETLAWLQERKIGLEEVVRVRGFFDANNISFKKPQLPAYNITNRITISLFAGATFVFLVSALPAALLIVKKTGTMIWVSPSIVTAWNGYSWQVRPGDCNDGEIELSQLGAYDKDVICEILTEEGNEEYLESSMLAQKIFGFMFWVLFGFFAFVAARALLVAKQAEALLERSLSHRPSQEQIPL